jgi:hypothetical protein
MTDQIYSMHAFILDGLFYVCILLAFAIVFSLGKAIVDDASRHR